MTLPAKAQLSRVNGRNRKQEVEKKSIEILFRARSCLIRTKTCRESKEQTYFVHVQHLQRRSQRKSSPFSHSNCVFGLRCHSFAQSLQECAAPRFWLLGTRTPSHGSFLEQELEPGRSHTLFIICSSCSAKHSQAADSQRMHTEGDNSVPPFLGNQGHKIHQSTVLMSRCGSK